MLNKVNTPRRVSEKYDRYLSEKTGGEPRGRRIAPQLSRSYARTCNPSVPFSCGGRTVMAVRCGAEAEERDIVVFVYEDGGVWRELEGARTFDLQDPFIQKIGDEYVLGGVRARLTETGKWGWLTEFYRGADLQSLRHFLSGPTLMKDIRFGQLAGGGVAVFTRPQGVAYRRKSGHIADVGFTAAKSLCDVDNAMMINAPNLSGVFQQDEWGGVNQVYTLKNGLLGIVGHIAWGEGEFREGLTVHYYGMAFVLDPATGAFSDPEIIAAASDFDVEPAGEARTEDVVFPGGIVRLENGKALFYGGVSDNQIGELEIQDPFCRYE